MIVDSGLLRKLNRVLIKLQIKKTIKEHFLPVIFVLFLTSLLLEYSFSLFTHFQWNSPAYYKGDALYELFQIKALTDKSFDLFEVPAESRLGAPFGYYASGFPNMNQLLFFFIKVLSFLKNDPAVVFNLFYFISFYLSGLTFYISFCWIGSDPKKAALFGLIFAFLPFHFTRLQHLMLTAYWMIPFGIALIFKFYLKTAEHQSLGVFSAFSISFLMMMTGAYYAYFFCLFFFFTLLILIINRKWRSLFCRELSAAILGMILGVCLQLFPFVNSQNDDLKIEFKRPYKETEWEGMKWANHMIPWNRSRLLDSQQLRSVYASTMPRIESDQEYFGIISIVGLAVSIYFLLFSASSGFRGLRFLGGISLLGFLFTWVGGGGAMLSYLGFTQIRAYNRMSIVLVGIGLFSFAIFWEILVKKNRLWNHRIVFLLIFMIFFLDIHPQSEEIYKSFRYEYQLDKREFQRLEAQFGGHRQYLIIPWMQFPEGILRGLESYDEIRPYLHTKTSLFSFGVMRRTKAERKIRNIFHANTLGDMIDRATAMGFDALMVHSSRWSPQFDRYLRNTLSSKGLMPEMSMNMFGDFRVYSLTDSIKTDY